MTDNKSTYNKLLDIPFLDLGPISNFDLLYEEAQRVYNKTNLTEMKTANENDNYHLNLSVEGLFDYKGFPEISAQCDSCLSDYKVQGKISVPFSKAEKTKPTVFSKQMPNTTKYISDMLDHPGRARFSVLKANTNVGWHTHFQSYDLSEVAVHFVIKTNPKVLAEVSYCKFENLKSPNDWYFEPTDKIYSDHFTQGHIWLLNTNHYHRFINTSDEDRIHIWVTTYLFDNKGNPVNEKLVSMISKAVANYQGPRVLPTH